MRANCLESRDRHQLRPQTFDYTFTFLPPVIAYIHIIFLFLFLGTEQWKRLENLGLKGCGKNTDKYRFCVTKVQMNDT